MEDTKVLIVGAGPTGLVLALWLTKFGIPLRIIDKDSGPGQTSRAMAFHARNLEFYQQIGIAIEAIQRGIIVEQMNIHKNGRIAASVNIGRIGKDESAFPFVLSFPQDEHEKFLIEELQKSGVYVERNTEFISYVQGENNLQALLKKQNETETISTPYIFGCDGAKSTVRTQLGLGFPGGTYSQLYYVSDVIADGEIVNGQMHLCITDSDFALAFPIRSTGSIRLIGIVPKENENKPNIEFSDVADVIKRDMQISVSKVNWFSIYHSHHRVADHFRQGRVFLLGDACHIHSPVGGQGMNTGIGDAVNLAWKVASVIQGKASQHLLDSYELERIGFAKKLTATTDKLFQAITNESLIGKFVRNLFFPHIFPFLIRFESVRHFLFNTVSQIRIHYPNSPISKGRAGKIKGGDRLPWIKDNTINNYKPLELLDWQIHIYGDITTQDFKNTIEKLGLKIYVFLWQPKLSKLGFQKNAVYLIRPDGYVAYANSIQDGEALKTFLSSI